jgi:hypothetical protein
LIPVTQTKFWRPADHPEGRQHGNCQRAAMASLLEIGIDDMPPFETAIGAGTFWRSIYEWMSDQGLKLVTTGTAPKGYAMAYGPASRGVKHAVVVIDGVLAHDPHPSGEGLLSVDLYDAIEPMTEAEKLSWAERKRAA